MEQDQLEADHMKSLSHGHLACRKTNSFQIRRGSTDKTSIHRTLSSADYESILHNAVARSDLTTMRNILEGQRVNVNYYRPPGVTALHVACMVGDVNIIELLVVHKADFRLKSREGLSPVQIAVANGHFEVAEYLISVGAEDNAVKDGVCRSKPTLTRK